MVLVQDRIELAADKLQTLQSLLHKNYLPGAERRGMRLLESQVSPPLALLDGNCTLWLRWQLPDVAAWWSMRAQAGTQDVLDFWSRVDDLCLFRERVYLSDDSAIESSSLEPTAPFHVATRGYRETAQLLLRAGIADSDKEQFLDRLEKVAALPGVEASIIGENLAPEYAVGHYTWDLLFSSEASAEQLRSSERWQYEIAPALETFCEACHALSLTTLGAGLRQPALNQAIKRTAYFRLLPGASEDDARRFERDLLEMPAHIPQILNWRLSRATELPWSHSDQPLWSYVWEQEFAALDDLLGPYMAHPHHWAHIDRWFDPESGVQAVDTRLSHAFSPLESSLMAMEALAPG